MADRPIECAHGGKSYKTRLALAKILTPRAIRMLVSARETAKLTTFVCRVASLRGEAANAV